MAKKTFENIGDDIFSAGLTPNTQLEATKNNAKSRTKKSKKDAYKIIITVEDDLQDYFSNIMWIKRNSKTGYINDLIRQDYMKTIGASKTASQDEAKEKWEEYKKQMRL